MYRNFYLLILFTLSAYSQPYYRWAQQKNFSYETYGWSVSVSNKNDVIVSGNFVGPYHQPDSNDVGSFLVKYDSLGELQWEKRYHSKYSTLCVRNTIDYTGNVYVSGNFLGYMQFESGHLLDRGMFFTKYDSKGNLLFTKESGKYAVPYEICINTKNEIYIAGYCWAGTLIEGHSMKKDGFIVKYRADGSLVWVKEFFHPGTLEKNFDMCLDREGNIYITGDFGSSQYLSDSIQIINSSSFDGMVAKYDQDANLIWVKTIKGYYNEAPRAIDVNHKGEVFIAGYHGGYYQPSTTYFDNFFVNVPQNSATDIFIAKYNNLGECEWVKSAGSDGIDLIRGIYADNYDNVFVTGYFGQGGPTGHATFSDQTVNSTGPGPDAFIANYGTDGNLKWVVGSKSDWSHGIDITGNDKGDLYLTGEFVGDFNFGSLNLKGNDEMFLLKMHYDISSGQIKFPEKRELYDGLYIFPNPTEGALHITYHSSKNTLSSIRIIDSKGQKIYSETIANQNGEFSKTIDLSKHAKGIYFIEVICGEMREVRKVVLE